MRIFALLTIGTLIAGCTAEKKQTQAAPAPATAQPASAPAPQTAALAQDTVTTPSGLKYIVTAAGKGGSPAKGTRVKAHYTGYLTNGTKFDSSVDRGQPFAFNVGMGMVIAGWDEAFLGMRKGEKRRLIIPPSLGYGESGMGPIPSNATLIFDVELIDF